MTGKKAADAAPPKQNLDSNYRPLGLKAVIAAALMLKRNSPKKAA